jgi:hypothetical protein
MMVIDEKFNLGQVVYLKVDPEQRALIVVSISVRPGHLAYVLSSGEDSVVAYDIELTETRNVLSIR